MKEKVSENKRMSFIYILKQNLWDSESQELNELPKDQIDKDELKQYEAANKIVKQLEDKYGIEPKKHKTKRTNLKEDNKVKSSKAIVLEKDSKDKIEDKIQEI